MRLVIQRVLDARVVVEGKVISEIGKGLMVLVGIGTGDTEAEIMWACQKILGVKLFCDKQGKMWRGSVMDM
jgi:D-tyrosyl-tRNA(Tyr) deacylase